MSLDSKVLLHFIQAPGQFISGTGIGESLGLSRVSVHNHLESLRKQGFEFSAIRNKGYRLEKEPEAFNPALFGALMESQACPFFKSYTAHGEVGSTNSMAESELADGRETPFFVVADAQTSGRGRRGRTWHSPQGKNLYLSCALRPALPPSRLQNITLWMGLRVCQFIRELLALPVLIKWPNDLMLHDRKIAGMLTEARVDAEFTRDLVFGLGLNVNSLMEDFPEELQSVAGSLALNLGKSLNLSRLAHQLVQTLATTIEDYLGEQFSSELSASWPEFDYLRGRVVNNGEINGRVLGISANGSLRIEREDGSIILLHSGEVTLGTGSV
ncbi:MAG: biotin--[acetyl-CoA-carboxylase] ligase [Opitutales bacterium]